MAEVEKRVAQLAATLPVDQKSVAQSVSKYGFLHAARLLSQSLHYPDQQMAGRLLVHYLRAVTPATVAEYVDANKDLLRPEISRFLLLHADTLDAVVREEEFSDMNHDFFSADTQMELYPLRPIKDAPVTENFQHLHLRMAAELFHRDGVDAVVEYYRQRTRGYFTHATPTMLNSGLLKNQLASCFLFHIGDNLESILYDGVGDVGIVSKHNGGIGINVADLRHSEIGRDGMSKGLAPILYLFNATNRLVDQGGTRKGAMTIFNEPMHLDVMAFIRTVLPTGEKHTINHDINTSLWTNWVFWRRLREKRTITLFCPKKAHTLRTLWGEAYRVEYERLEKLAQQQVVQLKALQEDLAALDRESGALAVERPEYRQKQTALARLRKEFLTHEIVDAGAVLKEMINAQALTGRPYVCSGDAATMKSNHRHLGRIRCSNLCQEIMEYSDEKRTPSCNLASLAQKNYVRRDTAGRPLRMPRESKDMAAELRACYDFAAYGRQVRHVVRGLNKIIDHSWAPLDKRDAKGNVVELGPISRPNRDDRPLGLGSSGLADAVALMDLPFADAKDPRKPDPRTRLFNRMIFACHYYNALAESVDLAMRTESYPTFRFVDEDGKERVSPFAEGKLQFDLWREEWLYLTENGKRPLSCRTFAEDEPMPPTEWGQPELKLYSGLTIDPKDWTGMRSAVKSGIRNSLLTAIMPTSTTSQIMCSIESVEAPQTNVYSRKTGTRAYLVVHQHLYADLTELKLNLDGVMRFIATEDGSVQRLRAFVEAQSKRAELEAGWEAYLAAQEEMHTMVTVKKLAAAKQEHEEQVEQSLKNFAEDPMTFLADRQLGLQNIREVGASKWTRLEAQIKAEANAPAIRAAWKIAYGQQQPLYPLLARGRLTTDELTPFLSLKEQINGYLPWDRLDYLQLKYRTMWELSQRIFLQLAADRGRYIDQSQSMNIYLRDPTPEQITALLLTSEELGNKTLMYYLRRMPAIRTSQFGSETAAATSVETKTVAKMEAAKPAPIAKAAEPAAAPVVKMEGITLASVTTEQLQAAKGATDAAAPEEMSICMRSQIDGKVCISCS